jgi:hypothetical protein
MTPPVAIEAKRPLWGQWSSRFCLRLAVVLWALPMVVIMILIINRPFHRSVTPLYHEAARNWWAGKDLYGGPSGMNYLPHFAVLFTPFDKLPVPVGDILWRFCAAGLLAEGLWRLVRQRFGEDASRVFLCVTLISLPVSLPALQNGQANAIFGALTLQAAAALAGQRWTGAAIWTLLALAVKPLGAVLLLLAPVVYAPLRWRLAVGLVILALSPFLFAPTAYVLGQYQSAARNLQACSVVAEHRFADISGILRTFHCEMPALISKGVRVCAGGIVLALWWLGARRLGEPMKAVWLLALATGYLMLFNPMNEVNSYVIVAPALGWWAVEMLGSRADRPAGWLFAGLALSMGCMPNLLRPLFGNAFALIGHPLMTAVFLVILARWVLRQKPEPTPAAVA